MKKIFFALAMSISLLGFSQEKIAEGVLKSKQTMSSPDEQVNAQFAIMGETITTTYFKKNKSRTETSSPMTGNTVAISDFDKKEMLMCIDNPMMGKKYMTQKMDGSQEETLNVEIKENNKVKTILGYECKGYEFTMMSQGNKIEYVIYTTDKLPKVSIQTTKFGNKIPGFPLYSKMKANQMGAVIVLENEVIDIKKEVVSDDKFDMTPPEGYEKADASMGM